MFFVFSSVTFVSSILILNVLEIAYNFLSRVCEWGSKDWDRKVETLFILQLVRPFAVFVCTYNFPLLPFPCSVLSWLSLIPGGYHCPGFSWLHLFFPQRLADGSPDPTSADFRFLVFYFFICHLRYFCASFHFFFHLEWWCFSDIS